MLENQEPLSLRIRPYRPSDQYVVVGTWIASLSAYQPYSSINRFFFSAAQRALAFALLDSGGCLVACGEYDEDHVYGYVVFRDRTLHWVYVRKPFRNALVGSRLMDSAFGEFNTPVIATARTPAIKKLSKRWNVLFDERALSAQVTEHFKEHYQ